MREFREFDHEILPIQFVSSISDYELSAGGIASDAPVRSPGGV
jgi:hypothetical protein